jgi:energy-coupling factor transporter transmembrane protein EcfT
MTRNNPVVGCIFAIIIFAFAGMFLLRMPFMFFSLFPMIIFFIIILGIIISVTSHKQRENRINELNSQVRTNNPYRVVNSNQNQVEIQNKKIESNSYQRVRFCHFCGTQLENDAIFCPGCGIEIER